MPVLRGGAPPGAEARWRRRRGWRDLGIGVIAAVLVGMCAICGVVGVALLLPAVQQAREAARRTQSKNNLKQIGLALHQFHDEKRSFPAGGTFGEDGKGKHGWMTSLLPYTENGALANQVDFDTPWDAPKHRPVFQTQIPMYLSPVGPQRVSADGYALSHYAGNVLVLGKNTSVTIANITDGTSNTILAGEVGTDQKPWGSPENMRHPSQFGRPDGTPGQGHQVLMGDGSVKFLANGIDPNIVKALATPDGNEPIPDF